MLVPQITSLGSYDYPVYTNFRVRLLRFRCFPPKGQQKDGAGDVSLAARLQFSRNQGTKVLLCTWNMQT